MFHYFIIMVTFLLKFIHRIKLYEKLLVNIIETLNLELGSPTFHFLNKANVCRAPTRYTNDETVD